MPPVPTFTESQAMLLAESCRRFDVTPVRFLDQGTNNHVWDVTHGNATCILRIGSHPEVIGNLQRELDMFHTFSSMGLGLQVLKSHIYSYSGRGVMALVYSRAEGSLSNYFSGYKDVAPGVQAKDMARKVIQRIHELASRGYFYGDMKPENLLIQGTQVYFGDLDPTFTVKDPWPMGSLNPTNLKNYKAVLQGLYERVMLFQLWMTSKKYHKGTRASTLCKEIKKQVDHLIRTGKKVILKQGTRVSPFQIIESLLGPSFSYPADMLNHYAKTKNTMHSQEFTYAIANYLNGTPLTIHRGAATKIFQTKNEKRKIGSACASKNECYSGVCTNGKCASKTKARVQKMKKGQPCQDDKQCYTGRCHQGVCQSRVK